MKLIISRYFKWLVEELEEGLVVNAHVELDEIADDNCDLIHTFGILNN